MRHLRGGFKDSNAAAYEARFTKMENWCRELLSEIEALECKVDVLERQFMQDRQDVAELQQQLWERLAIQLKNVRIEGTLFGEEEKTIYDE